MRVIDTAVLERSGENGYEAYRIPGIVSTRKGTLIAYYEARHGSDWSVIDLYARVSRDGGDTWGERQLLLSGRGKNTTNNPYMIADGDRVHLLCLENYKRLFHSVSLDEGRSWSEPREITGALEACRGEYGWTCAAVGPGHGIRLTDGRLLASVWLARCPADITRHWPSKVTTLFSDDRGETWEAGEIFVPEGSESPNEACLAPLPDGRVIMDLRSRKKGDGAHYRYAALSGRGSGNWETWCDRQLPDPACCAGMCDIPGGLLFSNCASFTDRACLTLRRSCDGGRTWTDDMMYEPDGGYSDVAYDEVTGNAFAFYEYGNESELRVSRIAL